MKHTFQVGDRVWLPKTKFGKEPKMTGVHLKATERNQPFVYVVGFPKEDLIVFKGAGIILDEDENGSGDFYFLDECIPYFNIGEEMFNEIKV